MSNMFNTKSFLKNIAIIALLFMVFFQPTIIFAQNTTKAILLTDTEDVQVSNLNDTNDSDLNTVGDIYSIKENIKHIKIANREGDLVAMAIYLLNQAIAFIGIIAVVFLIIGGVGYITAGGDDSKTEKANKTIINALVGLAIVLLSGFVVQFLVDRLMV